MTGTAPGGADHPPTRSALLLHGLSSDSSSWWRVRSWLEDAGWRVTAPELRGHGGSGPAVRYALEDYAGDALALRPEGGGAWDAVVGHSLGGATAVLAAAADPTWTRALVLLDPVVAVPAHAMPQLRADQLAELDVTADSLRADHPDWDERDVAAKLAGVRGASTETVARTFDDTGDWNVADEARELAMPTLVLGGDPEVFALFFPALGAMLARANPRIDYRVVAGAGHSPHREQPEAVRATVLEWLTAQLPPTV